MTTTTKTGGISNKNICPKFINLLKEKEKENCDSCQYHYDKEGCSGHDCTIDIKVCEDYECPNNHYYDGLKWKKAKSTLISRLTRNCLHGIKLISGPLIMEDIAQIYGLSRARIYQWEFLAKVSLIKNIKKDPNLQSLLTGRSLVHFSKMIAKKKEDDKAHEMIRLRRKERLATL